MLSSFLKNEKIQSSNSELKCIKFPSKTNRDNSKFSYRNTKYYLSMIAVELNENITHVPKRTKP